MSADEPPAETPEPVHGVRKSAAVHIHPVADPQAWRNAVLPDPLPAAADRVTDAAPTGEQATGELAADDLAADDLATGEQDDG